VTDESLPREATVNRDSDGTALGVMVFLDAPELQRMGIDTRECESIEYEVVNNSLSIYGKEEN